MTTESPAAPVRTLQDFVPLALWHKDHWSTLAYSETVMVECGGFQLGMDPRMKSSRRNFRVMSQECPRPKRPSGAPMANAMFGAMRPEHATKLRDGSQVEGHDDWACLQDAAHAGFFTVGEGALEPGVTLHLSPLGAKVVAALRAHKAAGGHFAGFVWDETAQAA